MCNKTSDTKTLHAVVPFLLISWDLPPLYLPYAVFYPLLWPRSVVLLSIMRFYSALHSVCWVTVNYKCYKVQRLTPDSGANKEREKQDTQQTCNFRLRLVFYHFYRSIFARKLIIPMWHKPPLAPFLHHNTPPAVLHTKEFESSLGRRNAAPG